MACPKSLSDFLQWASRAINARRYMVILSGHGAGFLGAMADFSHGGPQIMGIPQMAKAFNRALKNSRKKVYYLLMDACYMNLVENAYEFALRGTAKVFLGSGGLVPLKGYDYRLIIERFCLQELFSGAKSIAVNNDLNGVEATLLDKHFLTLLKQQLSGVAERLIRLGISPAGLNADDETLISLSELLNKILNRFSTDAALTEFSIEALELLKKIELPEYGVKIFCPGRQETFTNFAGYYGSLSFSRNNFWPVWLSGGMAPAGESFNGSFSSTFLPLGVLTEHLLNLNAGMTIAEIKKIYQQLGWTAQGF
ncbi:MAG: hypothetical protein K6T80_04645 [Firmicutes bacterium]|nr:hypothetical protein [Bacillota bacterium]